MKRVYLIKNINPWMMSELLSFSKFCTFKVIFIRKVPDSYSDDLAKLKQRGVFVIDNPFNKNIKPKDIIFSTYFFFNNIDKIWGHKKNIIWTLTSIYWFCLLDKKYFNGIKSIHSQFASQAAILSLMVKKYYKKENINYYFTFHAHDIYLGNRWLKKLVNNSSKAFSISQFNINYVKNKYKINASKISIHRLGVETLTTQLEKIQKSKVINIGFLSAFNKKKGIPVLLKAIKKLVCERKLNLVFHIAGYGILDAYIRDFISKHKLNDFVIQYGKTTGKQKELFYENLDIFVLPSTSLKNDMDGIPVVLMEAIKHGVPIISTNISGIPEICIDGYNGMLIPEKNAGALADAIEKMSQDETLRLKISKNALALANDMYDICENSKKKLMEMGWINRNSEFL